MEAQQFVIRTTYHRFSLTLITGEQIGTWVTQVVQEGNFNAAAGTLHKL
jgi:hypothetical protein